ncbi:MAG: carbohydrate-binding domain-containing protein [Spirochaetales bacterium]|nr:carbohydrate-binding domain-containing protein [Spirochaetales bacterium]
MKRFLTITILAMIITASLFAQSIVEVTHDETSIEADTVTDRGIVIDLTSGTSTSDLVKAAFNKDGNLEVTYKGTEPVSMTLTGTLNGTLIVKSDDAPYTLILDEAYIFGTTLPAIQLKSTTTATFLIADGSSNTISDSPENTKKGAITSSGDIVFEGTSDALLDIFVYKKHGIKTDGGVTVNGANIVIIGDEAAEGNMISADMFFVMNGGYLTIYADGNVHATESKGIKVNGVEAEGGGSGYVEINGGQLYIESVGKAITAGWKLSEDATTEGTSDDPIPDVYINGGNIMVITTGTPYEYSDDESLSPEGIEAKNNIIINGGNIYAWTTDDSLNAGNSVIINGGYVFAFATDNDSIDSNGTIEINGGTVVCMSSSREQAFDCDNDSNFKYTGGTYVGAGNGNNMPKASGTTGYSIAYGNTTFYAGDQIAVLDENGDVIIGFIVPYEIDNLTSIVFGSPAFTGGKTYTIALGAFKESSLGLVDSGAEFKMREEVVSMDLTDNTVSEGYIGMNVGGDMGFGDMGFGNMGFGGQNPPDMQPDFQGGNFPGNMNGGFGGRADISIILQMLVQNSADTELPSEVAITGDLDSEEAIQAMLYLLGNYVDFDDFQTLFEGSMENGEFDMPQGGPRGNFNPGNLTPPQVPQGPFGN